METFDNLRHKVQWQASLSNGEMFFEGKGDFVEYENGVAPWQRFIKYAIERGLEITSVGLYTEDGRSFNLPSAGNKPKFREFWGKEKPIDFDVRRKFAREAGGIKYPDGKVKIDKAAVAEWYTVAVAIYPDYELQIWVDELNPKNCWTLIEKLR